MSERSVGQKEPHRFSLLSSKHHMFDPQGSQRNLTKPRPARTREGIAVSTASVERPGPRGGRSWALIDAYGSVCWCNFSPKGSVEEAKTCRGARSLTK